MKEIMSKVFLLLLATSWSYVAKAGASGLDYSYGNGTATVIPPIYVNRPYSGDIVIPETITEGGKTYRVTKIANQAFANQAITSIVIGDNVESIGNEAFVNCRKLTHITMGAAVKKVGNSCFYNNSSLTRLDIRNLASWCVIDWGTSASCNPMSVAQEVYVNGEPLIDIVIPSSVTRIGAYAFANCKSAKTLTLPEEMNTIGLGAFYGCSGLASVIIPSSVSSIEALAFYGCSGLQKVKIMGKICTMGDLPFAGAKLLRKAGPIGSNSNYEFAWDTEIPEYAFCETGLEEITLPEGIKKLNKGCFWSTKLQRLVIPSSVEYIGDYALASSSLRSLLVLSENAVNFESCPETTQIYCPWPQICEADQSSQLHGIVSLSPTAFEYSGRTPEVIAENLAANEFPELSCHPDFSGLSKDAGLYVTTVPVKLSGFGECTIDVHFNYRINQAPLTVTADNKTREYGVENPTLTYSIIGLKNGDTDAVLTDKRITTYCTKSSDAGTYNINVSASAKNYNVTCVKGTLTITKVPLVAHVVDSERDYGQENNGFYCTYEGLRNGDYEPKFTVPFSVTTDAKRESNAGQYIVRMSGGEATNYYFTEIVPGYLTIRKVPLEVNAYANRLYYEDNPPFSLSYSGFRLGEDENVLITPPQVTTTVTKETPVGRYPVTLSGGEATNYYFQYMPSRIDIYQRQVTATVHSYSRQYGQANPDFEIDYDGFVAGQDESVLLEPIEINCSADELSDVGEYVISLSKGKAQNYWFWYNSGYLKITQAEQELTWDQTFDNCHVGDQIKLLATVNSDRPITYEIDAPDKVSLYKAGYDWYIDCRKAGVVYIRAQQEGSKNYLPSNRIAKKLVIDDSTAIDNINFDTLPFEHYSTDGRRINGLQNGVNIIRTEDGRSLKVLKK